MSKSTTSLLHEFVNEPVRRGGQVPLINRIMSEMSEADAEDMKKALHNPSIPIRSIVTVLERRGHKIAMATIQRYRRDNGIV
jgi:hypothetical protein